MMSSEQLGRVPLRVRDFVFDSLAVGDPEAPLVLFLHGFPQFAESWADIMVPIANAGFRAVAVDQRGYSPGARPEGVAAYDMSLLVGDILEFADALGAHRFHLVAHDWGGILAWRLAAERPGKLLSLTVLSTPHTDALLNSIARDPVQAAMSQYIHFFRQPGGVAEAGMLANGAERLRAAFRGKLSTQRLETHVARLSVPGALTAALNWYRALDFDARIGPVHVDTLFIWGSADHALGEIAANDTADFVRAPYRFVRLDECSHWLMDEVPEDIVDLLLERLR
ncbi:alpha/beta fold hydrolase [Steroidobacter flavus]|uniref:Alpha/beta fold hydrolase n=1 Tax=Steroidobacter flavus TaxID=1842136 RepID=A0ABV8T2E0_9GAMM